jgi:hypothetical protein
MPKGGPREDAGRPRGSRERGRKSVAEAESLSPTPLKVLLESIHRLGLGTLASRSCSLPAHVLPVHPYPLPIVR